MSDYPYVTRHPQTGKYEIAQWRDDYFGPHIYGVEFDSDKKVYPVDLVKSRGGPETLWTNDVILTLRDYGWDNAKLADFFNDLQRTYKARWKRDPVTGEGALGWFRRFAKKDKEGSQ